MAPRIVIISAPSGAGKTTLVRRLLQRLPVLCFSVSATTRPPRPPELDGRDYYFWTEEQFRAGIAAGAFVESEEVYPGRFYGTLAAEIDRIAAEGRCPIFDVDVQGGLNLKRQYAGQALAVFLAPPTLEALRERLVKRGTESADEVESRLRKAEYEMAFAPQFDYYVVNDEVERSLGEVEGLINGFLAR